MTHDIPTKVYLSQTYDVMKKFSSEVLSKFWGEYHLFVWNANKEFSSFDRNEIKRFINNIPTILDFINDNFEETQHLWNVQWSEGMV